MPDHLITDSARATGDSGFPFAAPLPVRDAGPRTVVNPERRGSEVSPPGGGSDNSILRRLFTRDDDGRPEPLVAEGLIVEHFEILERIGVGGMSAVFLARDTRLDRHVALKVLAPEQARDPDAVLRFHNEARAAARLDHPNIVRSLYIGHVEGLHFIAYEYVEGPNLREIIRREGRLDVREAVNYSIQIALALQHAAARDIVHRDIKPSNIVIAPNARAKLVDLGLARLPAGPGGELTIAGTTLGTFDYVSPEQAQDPRRVDVRSDIYSLGCTLYHMLTGEPPYPEGTMLQKLLDHKDKQPPNPATINRRVPPSLGGLCQRMMASNPRKRPENAEVLLHELSAVAAELGLHATHPEGFVWGVPQRSSTFLANHLGWMTTVGVLLVIVLFLDRIPSGNAPEPRPAGAGSDTPVVGPLDLPADPIEGGLRELLPETGDPAPHGETHPDPRTNPGTTQPIVPDPPAIGPTELVDPPVEPRGDSDVAKPPAGDTGEKPPLSRPPTTEGEPSPTKPKDPLPPTDRGPRVVPPRPADGPAFAIVPTEADFPPRTFGTLSAAVAAAEDGSVIELAFDGERMQRPIRVSGKHLVIRAAAGFRPTLRFVHEKVPSEGEVLRMITVAKGGLDVINLDVVLDVDRAVPVLGEDRWALFSLTGSQRAELRNSTVTIRNPGGSPVAVVEVREGSDRPLMPSKMMKPTDPETARASVRIANSLIRGDTSVIALDRTGPARIDLEGTLFAVSGAVVRVLGTTTPAGENDYVDLTANHLTALVGDGFVVFDSGDLPRYLPPLHVTAHNNLFTTRSGRALVAARGLDDLQDFRNLLRWTGGTNYYDGFELFWDLPEESRTATEIGFEAWRELWGATTDHGTVTWSTPPTSSGYEETAPADLALDPEAPANPAIGGATDDTDVGADLSRVGAPDR